MSDRRPAERSDAASGSTFRTIDALLGAQRSTGAPNQRSARSRGRSDDRRRALRCAEALRPSSDGSHCLERSRRARRYPRREARRDTTLGREVDVDGSSSRARRCAGRSPAALFGARPGVREHTGRLGGAWRQGGRAVRRAPRSLEVNLAAPLTSSSREVFDANSMSEEALLGALMMAEGSQMRSPVRRSRRDACHHEQVRRFESDSWSAEGSSRARR
jgi:hypothetical protein